MIQKSFTQTNSYSLLSRVVCDVVSYLYIVIAAGAGWFYAEEVEAESYLKSRSDSDLPQTASSMRIKVGVTGTDYRTGGIGQYTTTS